MTVQDWVGVIGLFITIVVFIVGAFRYSESKREKLKEEFGKKHEELKQNLLDAVKEVIKDSEKARGRIYERFDEHKKNIEEKIERNYTPKDVCDLRHFQSDERLKKIEDAVSCLPDLKAKFEAFIAKKQEG